MAGNERICRSEVALVAGRQDNVSQEQEAGGLLGGLSPGDAGAFLAREN